MPANELDDNFFNEFKSLTLADEAAQPLNLPEKNFLKHYGGTVSPIRHDVSRYLPNNVLKAFVLSCKNAGKIMAPQLKINQLLSMVVLGKEDDAKAILEQKDPKTGINNYGLLMLNNGRAIDHVGREFENYTPLQAALAAGDTQMCDMLIKRLLKLPGGQEIVKEQIKGVFPNGIDAHIAEQKKSVFDFSKIFKAVKEADIGIIEAINNKPLSEETKLGQDLAVFRREFEKKSKSEIIFNPYHLLKFLELYEEKYNELNFEQRCLLSCLVYGWAQRVGFPANYAQAYRMGIDSNSATGNLDRSFDFKSWCSFSNSGGCRGLGIDYFVALEPVRVRRRQGGVRAAVASGYFRIFCQTKTTCLQKLLSPVGATTSLKL